MDPSPTTYPLLSYVMSLLPFDGPAFNPQDPSATSSSTDPPHIVNQMPHLSSPNVLSSMIHAVSVVSQTRSFLQNLGPRPDHESVNMARSKLAEIVSSVTKSVEELGLCPRPLEVDLLEWRAFLVSEELEVRKEADKEKPTHRLILQLDEMHEAYEKLLKEAEQRLVKIYENTEKVGVNSQEVEEEVNEDVAMVLQETERRALERVELSERRIRVLPQAFGKINEWIAGFGKLEQLNLASNLLEITANLDWVAPELERLSLKNCSILFSVIQAELPLFNFDLDEEKQRCRRRTAFGKDFSSFFYFCLVHKEKNKQRNQ
ncbi:hypothetical protein ES288_D13G129700v1 [Gossypium darwinii]|uniref:Uncharacterized protein n=1 Tax=Gossypium darwinii TaxID=34276 RepID=A0A5D2A071_GOSDA|nr:hypothetical protein ES288_D13G129700v1 [Gossypium darwinii]